MRKQLAVRYEAVLPLSLTVPTSSAGTMPCRCPRRTLFGGRSQRRRPPIGAARSSPPNPSPDSRSANQNPRVSVTRHKDPLFGTDRHIEGGSPVLGRAGGAVRGPG